MKSFVFLALVFSSGVALAAGGPNGSGSDMTALYDGQEFTINLKEFPANANAALLEHNTQTNTIYQYDDVDEGTPESPFFPVLDAIQADGFNPIWQEAIIHFAPGVEPFQLGSDDDIFAAEDAGLITVELTDELYRCSVVGPKK